MLLYSYADVVQWLVYGLAKAGMRVRFPSFAPLRELLTPSCEFYITKNILCHSLIMGFFHV